MFVICLCNIFSVNKLRHFARSGKANLYCHLALPLFQICLTHTRTQMSKWNHELGPKDRSQSQKHICNSPCHSGGQTEEVESSRSNGMVGNFSIIPWGARVPKGFKQKVLKRRFMFKCCINLRLYIEGWTATLYWHATFTHQCCCATRCAPKNCTREGLGGSAILSHNTKLRNTISSIAGSTLLLHWSMASNTLAISIAINLNIIQGTLYFNHHFQSNWWSTLPPAAAHLLPLLGPLHMLKIWWDYVLHRAQILQSSPCRQCCVLRCTRKM